MALDTWRILPRAGGSFHFGRHGLGQEETALTFTSDSLFAALVAYAAQHAPASLTQLVSSGGEPPIVLTSAFPWVHGIRLFPKLMLPTHSATDTKNLKRVIFVSEGVYRQMLAGASLERLYAAAHTAQSGQVLFTDEERAELLAKLVSAPRKKNGANASAPLPDFWKSEQRPRVTLDRASSASNLFFTGGVTFAPGCGLWFGLHWRNPDSPLKNDLPALFAGLGDAGIGGDRSAGYGICTFDPGDPLDLPAPSLGGYWTNLSRYIPTEGEISALTAPDAGYSLERVGGYITSPASMGVRRRAANMLAEGALLGAAPGAVAGQLADVCPTFDDNNPIRHPVWRNGQTIAVGVSLKEGAA